MPCAKTYARMFCNTCPGTLLYKCISLIFLVQNQKSGFQVWGSLKRIEKAKTEKENPFPVQPSSSGASVVATLSIGNARANTSLKCGAA